MKKLTIIAVFFLLTHSLFSQTHPMFNQMDWGILFNNGGLAMKVYKPLGDLSEEKTTKLGFVSNITILNIDQTGDVAFITQFAPGIGVQTALNDNFFAGADLCLAVGFSWIKEYDANLSSIFSNAHTWNPYFNYGFNSSLYVGFNTGGELKRFTIRAGVNPFAALSYASNPVGDTNYFGSTFSLAFGFALNKTK